MALVVAGVDDTAWQGYLHAVAAAEPTGGGGLLPWHLDRDTLRRSPASPPRAGVDILRSASQSRPPLRLSVTGNLVPPEVLPWLLDVPDVDSAILPVRRPPGSLRRRPWRWPLRIGLLPTAAPTEEETVGAVTAVLVERGRLSPDLVDIRDVRLEPAAVDLLVVTGSLDAAVAAVAASRQVANAVVVCGSSCATWAVDNAQLALIRAHSAAVLSALVPSVTASEALERVLLAMADDLTADVALTQGFGRSALLAAEPVAVETAHRSAMGQPRTASPRHTSVPARTPLLTCTVGSDNTFHPGPNTIRVSLWPRAVPPEATAGESGSTPADATAARLTVLIIPQRPPAPPSRVELDVPAAGASPGAEFVLPVGPGEARVSARLVVLYRNRVLQTAVVTGDVDGAPTTVTELAVTRRDLADLDDRRPYDVALLANHADDGCAQFTSHCDGYTKVDAMDDLGPITERLRRLLVVPSAKPTAEATRALLIDLAVQGHDLYMQLSAYLSTLPTAHRIQIVTARSTWFLPLELAYARRAPDPDATLCQNWLDGGGTCGPDCGTGPDDPKTLCPMAFWGMGKTIERHYLDEALPQIGAQFLLIAEPRAKARSLSVDRAILGASSKVSTASVQEALTALGAGVHAQQGWQAWVKTLKGSKRDLLVLMPHADTAAATLEISTQTLDRGRIHPDYVTGGHAVQPVVILFGCDTAGSLDDPAGYATRFMQCGAATVFTSLTMLRTSHAADLATRLCTMLQDPDRQAVPLAELLTRFRQDALRAGHPVALAITAQGDADWTV